MKNRNIDHSDCWATPPKFYEELNKEFNFDFDPCPLNWDGFEVDGLEIEWGYNNFINPPYSQKGKEAFIKKALEQSKKHKLCVMLLPVSTSTRVFHDLIKPNAKEIRFLRGRIPFIGINTKGQYVNWHLWDQKAPEGVEHVKANGMHDSMIVVFGESLF